MHYRQPCHGSTPPRGAATLMTCLVHFSRLVLFPACFHDRGKFIFAGFCRRLLVVLNFLHKREITGWRSTWGRIHCNNKMMGIIPHKHTPVPFTSTSPRVFPLRLQLKDDLPLLKHEAASQEVGEQGGSARASYLPVLFKIKRQDGGRDGAELGWFYPPSHHECIITL